MSKTAKSSGAAPVEKGLIYYVPIILVGVLICGVPSAILNSCAGIYYPVMAEDFGVPVSQISLWRTCDYITGIIASPIAGVLLAKRNPKLVILIAAAVESLVFVGFGMSTEVWMLWILGGIAGITNAVMLGVGVAVIINMWFRSGTGLIIGICTAFTGFGGIVFSPIAQSLIDAGGWRYSYITLGIAAVLIMVIGICLFLKGRPEDVGILPYGTAKYEAKMAEAGAITGAFVTGAELTAFNSAGNAAGKVGLGIFSDIDLRVAICILCGCGMVGLLFMWQFPNSVLLPIGSVLMGVFIAAVLVVMPMIVRAVFGSGASYPIIWSNIGMSLGLGGACGSYIWGFISENLGGFSAVFGGALICMAILWVLSMFIVSKKDLLPKEELTEADLTV